LISCGVTTIANVAADRKVALAAEVVANAADRRGEMDWLIELHFEECHILLHHTVRRSEALLKHSPALRRAYHLATHKANEDKQHKHAREAAHGDRDQYVDCESVVRSGNKFG
jgi:hypothetical protein